MQRQPAVAMSVSKLSKVETSEHINILSRKLGKWRRCIWFLMIICGITYSLKMIAKCAINFFKYPASIKPNLNSKDVVRFPKGNNLYIQWWNWLLKSRFVWMGCTVPRKSKKGTQDTDQLFENFTQVSNPIWNISQLEKLSTHNILQDHTMTGQSHVTERSKRCWTLLFMTTSSAKLQTNS